MVLKISHMYAGSQSQVNKLAVGENQNEELKDCLLPSPTLTRRPSSASRGFSSLEEEHVRGSGIHNY